ncbi:hypothetical protein E2562_033729 [Oryza meyeriana var. granulata]|uniref:Uncharacterized protein n=1 Tax=Oryza meyeriana var. granulata TaxID=110450 RepID=A0A6G1CBE4_9ORYZ|nr:hypothetical protein E2562_033729 [Oryza meyeriana var. granulata]
MASMVDKDGWRGALISKMMALTGEAASRRRAACLRCVKVLRGGGTQGAVGWRTQGNGRCRMHTVEWRDADRGQGVGQGGSRQ